MSEIAPGSRSAFVLAGDALVTVQGRKSRFTFRIIKEDVWFAIECLFGPENDNAKHYRFLAAYRPDQGVRGLRNPHSQRAKALVWFLNHIEDDRMRVYHAGKCGRCGRILTTPESIERGLGPVCATKGE